MNASAVGRLLSMALVSALLSFGCLGHEIGPRWFPPSRVTVTEFPRISPNESTVGALCTTPRVRKFVAT